MHSRVLVAFLSACGCAHTKRGGAAQGLEGHIAGANANVDCHRIDGVLPISNGRRAGRSLGHHLTVEAKRIPLDVAPGNDLTTPSAIKPETGKKKRFAAHPHLISAGGCERSS